MGSPAFAQAMDDHKMVTPQETRAERTVCQPARSWLVTYQIASNSALQRQWRPGWLVLGPLAESAPSWATEAALLTLAVSAFVLVCLLEAGEHPDKRTD